MNSSTDQLAEVLAQLVARVEAFGAQLSRIEARIEAAMAGAAIRPTSDRQHEDAVLGLLDCIARAHPDTPFMAADVTDLPDAEMARCLGRAIGNGGRKDDQTKRLGSMLARYRDMQVGDFVVERIGRKRGALKWQVRRHLT